MLSLRLSSPMAAACRCGLTLLSVSSAGVGSGVASIEGVATSPLCLTSIGMRR